MNEQQAPTMRQAVITLLTTLETIHTLSSLTDDGRLVINDGHEAMEIIEEALSKTARVLA